MRSFYGYIRVSTVKQGQHGVSLQEQKDAIERYAATHGFALVEWFRELETAAKRGRPAFTIMLEKLKTRAADGVIIHKIDRSARNLRDWADLGELIDAGIEVHFTAESLDLSSRGGRLSADIQAVVAADYIRNLREETKKGLYGRLKQGLYPWGAPLGYLDQGKAKPKVPDPERAPFIRRAFELYATATYDLKRLRKELQLLGLTNRRGGPLSLSGLNTILRNPFYTGLIKVKRTGMMYTGVHEPLISLTTFDRVQAVLNGKLNARVRKHDFLFRRLLTCGHCGYSLIGELQKGRVYYRCHTEGCPTTGVREDSVKAHIDGLLAPMQLTDEELAELQAALSDLGDRKLELQRDHRAALELSKGKINERLTRLTDAYIDRLIDEATFMERRESLLRELRALEERLASTTEAQGEALAAVSKFLERVKSIQHMYNLALPHEKRDFLRDATSNRLVRGRDVEIRFFPLYESLRDRGKLECCAHARDGTRTMAANIACSDPLCTKQRSEKALALVERLAGLLAEHKTVMSARQL